MRMLSVLVAAFVIAGCATPTVYMDPKSGAVQQCDPHARPLVRQAEIDKCSAAFERMGWKKQ